MAITLQPEATSGNGSKPQATDSFLTNKLQGSLATARDESLPAQLPVIETDFAVLQDGSLVELIEDPNNPARTLLLVSKDGHVEYTDRLEYGGQILVPLQRNNEILKRLRLPRGTKPFESVGSLVKDVNSLLMNNVVLDPGYPLVLTYFVLSTWLVDRFLVAPYVALIGLPASGKTTLLKVLSLVCRRAILTVDIPSAAFFQTYSRLIPTLLIDEAGSYKNNQEFRRLLRMGTTRGVLAIQGNHVFHAFGPKVISWLEPPDDPALNSRCILAPMKQVNEVRLNKLAAQNLEEQAAELQAKLLQFRLANYAFPRIPVIAGAEDLPPRTRDLLNCLAAPLGEDPERHQWLLRFFARNEPRVREPLSPAQNAVLRALFQMAHQEMDFEKTVMLDFTWTVNQLLRSAGENARLEARKVGAVLTSLGFTSRCRTSRGYAITLTRSERERVHDLARTSGIDGFQESCLPPSAANCPLCQKDPVRTKGEKRGFLIPCPGKAGQDFHS